MKKFFTSLLILTIPLAAQDIYDAVEQLPFDPSGYFATQHSLDKIFKENNIRTVIEVGSWAGASTRFFAYRVGPHGVVYAIDHWKGTPSHRGENSNRRLPYIYHLFLSNIAHAGLSDRIVPIRMDSDEACRALDVSADLIYLDASRTEHEVYDDIMSWITHLNQDGILCGTEYREPKVRKGVDRAANDLGLEVSKDRRGYFWQLR